MGYLGAFWGIAGVLSLVGFAILKITPAAVDAFSFELQWYHWLVLILNTAFIGYMKGYRGFQRALSPRVAARARHLSQHPTLAAVLLAPLYCMGYFHSLRRKQMVTIMMTVFMVILIILVRQLSQPWRGVFDAGILIGLSWGFFTILVYSVQAFTTAEFNHSPQLPAGQRS
jgi:hypothetical protein